MTNTEWPKGIFLSNPENAIQKNRLKEIITRINEGFAPNQWMTSPASNSDKLDNALKKLGLIEAKSWPAMYLSDDLSLSTQ